MLLVTSLTPFAGFKESIYNWEVVLMENNLELSFHGQQ